MVNFDYTGLVRILSLGRIIPLCYQQRNQLQQSATYPEDGYPGRLGPSAINLLTVTVLHLLWPKRFPHSSNTYKELCIRILFERK